MSAVLSPELVVFIGDRIKNIKNAEVRDLFWQVAEEVYGVGVDSGKSYAAHIEAYNRQAVDSAGTVSDEDEAPEIAAVPARKTSGRRSAASGN
jgi:hypothetical protein